MPQIFPRISGAHMSLQDASQAELAKTEVPLAWPVLPHHSPEHQGPLMPMQHSPPRHPTAADGCQGSPTHRTARPCRQDTAARHRRARERGCSRQRRRPGVRLHTWGWRPLRARGSRARDQAGRPHRASTCTAPLQLPAWGSQHSAARGGTGPIQGHLWISSRATGRTAPLVPAQGRQGPPKPARQRYGASRGAGVPMLSG